MEKIMNNHINPDEAFKLLVFITDYEKTDPNSIRCPRCNGEIVAQRSGNSYEVECLICGIKSGSRGI